MADLSVKIGSLKLKNPVMVASGTFGYGEEFHESFYDVSRLGAVVTKGISLEVRAGNAMPRVVETASGMLNAIGLANVGVEAFIREKVPFLKKAGATVIANILGRSVDEYAEVARKLDAEPGVHAIEINISCPNVRAGGVQFGTNPALAAEVTRAARKAFGGTLIVKLSPQASDIPAMARAVAEAGADSLSLINSIPAMAIDAASMRPVLANVTGGLSGPAIKPIALRMVYEASRAVDIPIIGMGGIMDATDAVEFMLAGASAIQVGTANFVTPGAAVEIIEGLGIYCKEKGFKSIRELVGGLKAGS
ncbi:MAG TPA: dihydroorotate dehydrogenase [bacterium]|nr:dihydroorotate dehydrogenase [bacterium]